MNENLVDFMQDFTPEDFAVQMLKRTSTDGSLRLYNWYDVKCEDCLTYNNFSIKMKWTKNDLEKLILEYKQLIKALEIIARNYDELDGSLEKARELLPDESVVSAYFIFIMPFDANNKNLNAQVIDRVGEKPYGYELIAHAQRLCRLLSLRAPAPVIRNEERYLIASMAIHCYASQIEKFENS